MIEQVEDMKQEAERRSQDEAAKRNALELQVEARKQEQEQVGRDLEAARLAAEKEAELREKEFVALRDQQLAQVCLTLTPRCTVTFRNLYYIYARC